MCMLCEDKKLDLTNGTSFAIASAVSSNHVQCMIKLWNYNPSYGDLYLCARQFCSIEALEFICQWALEKNPKPKALITTMVNRALEIQNTECFEFLDKVKSTYSI